MPVFQNPHFSLFHQIKQHFALLRKVELVTRCGERGVLPPRLDRETVRWTVSSIVGYLETLFFDSGF
jgi:hypothetical protein